MRIYYWMKEENEKEFDKVSESENFLGLVPNKFAKAEGIRDLYLFLAIAEDKTGKIEFDDKRLSMRIIEMFKESKCYQEKTEAERKEIIDFIRKNSGAMSPLQEGFIINV